MRPYDTSWTGNKDVKLRNYTNIYVSNNTDDPVGDSIKLGYVSSIDDINLVADQYTFFHFPLSATSGSNLYDRIQNTSLINDGATYGSCPYKSDRIYKLKNEYQDTTPYGLAQPKALNNGKWLCTWLSGNVLDPDSNPKWVDRWFDPGNGTTEDEALRVSGGESVYDIDSQMSLDYGAYYKYFRVGNKAVDAIDDSVSLDGSRLPLRINDWKAASANEVYTYLNADSNTLFNDRVSNDFDDDDYAISFNGKNQAATILLEEKTGFRTDSKYTIAFWVKIPDWANATSYAFVDNMHFGGWRFGVVNHAMDPYLFLHGNDSATEILDGTVCAVNANGELLSTKAFWKTDPDMHNVMDTLYDIDGYFFVLMTNPEKTVSTICKLDVSGNRLAEVTINAGLEHLDLSNEDRGFVLYAYLATEDRVKLYQIDRYTMQASLIQSTDPSVFNCNVVIGGDSATDYQVANYYNIGVLKIYDDYFVYDKTIGWISDNGDKTEDGEWLDRRQNLKFHRFVEKDAFSVVCDYNNDAWALMNGSIVRYSVIHSNYQKVQEFTARVGAGGGALDIIEVNQNGKNKDLLVVISYDRKSVVFYDTDGSFVNSIDTAKFFVHPDNIRSVTSYEWYRRNKKFTRCAYFDIMDSVTHRIIPVGIDSLSNNDWHHFAVVVDGDETTGKYLASLYVDCGLMGERELLASDRLKGISTYYKYDSGIVLGGMVGKTGPVFSELNVTNGAMKCSIDDFRIYNCPLKQEDLYYMMLTKYSCIDLVWHFKSQARNFVEEIEKFYKFKMPGSKSAHYVLHVKGYEFDASATEEDKIKIRTLLEVQMRDAFKKIAPAYTDLLKIVWEN